MELDTYIKIALIAIFFGIMAYRADVKLPDNVTTIKRLYIKKFFKRK